VGRELVLGLVNDLFKLPGHAGGAFRQRLQNFSRPSTVSVGLLMGCVPPDPRHYQAQVVFPFLRHTEDACTLEGAEEAVLDYIVG
jgi:hypothetical protein